MIPDPNILHYEHIITITSKDEDILSLFSKIIEKFVLGAEDIILKEKKYPEDVCYIEKIIESAASYDAVKIKKALNLMIPEYKQADLDINLFDEKIKKRTYI